MDIPVKVSKMEFRDDFSKKIIEICPKSHNKRWAGEIIHLPTIEKVKKTEENPILLWGIRKSQKSTKSLFFDEFLKVIGNTTQK